jgi:transposase InsO family protein
VRTTRRDGLERAPAAPDLVKRNFVPEAPDRLWVADITYARSWEGWLYLALSGSTPTPARSWAGRWRTTSGQSWY